MARVGRVGALLDVIASCKVIHLEYLNQVGQAHIPRLRPRIVSLHPKFELGPVCQQQAQVKPSVLEVSCNITAEHQGLLESHSVGCAGQLAASCKMRGPRLEVCLQSGTTRSGSQLQTSQLGHDLCKTIQLQCIYRLPGVSAAL